MTDRYIVTFSANAGFLTDVHHPSVHIQGAGVKPAVTRDVLQELADRANMAGEAIRLLGKLAGEPVSDANMGDMWEARGLLERWTREIPADPAPPAAQTEAAA